MAVDCDPRALTQAASCLQACVNAGMADAIKIYLLATIAGVDPDPAALIQAASCLQCTLPPGMAPAVEASLLCQIASGAGGAGALLTALPSDELFFSQAGIDARLNAVNLVGVTDIVFRVVNYQMYWDLETCHQLKTISFPNMLSFGAGGASYIQISDNNALVSFSAPLLTTFNVNSFSISFNSLLTGVDLSSLVSIIGANVQCRGNPALVNINWPQWIPTPTFNVNFSNDALSAASVNHILARCVASPTWGNVGENLDLSGGTNAAPSGQGIVDKATLIGRGAIVNTN